MNAPVRLPLRHIVQTQPFSREWLETLFKSADQLNQQHSARLFHEELRGKIMAVLFYEPSTRTRLSFESAMLRLGGRVIGTENAREFSSAAKGETLEDSIRVVSQYADAIVLRHHENNAARRAAEVSPVPIINAGCGSDQHPTQAMLDVYTIWRRHKDFSGLRVALMGDLKHGRTVRSLAYLLGKYPGVELYFVSPNELRLEQDIRMHFSEHKVKFVEYDRVDDIVDVIDVLYVTRVQTERMHEEDRSRLAGSYKLRRGLAQNMKKGSIIMHPLPRNGEIAEDVDTLPGAVYLSEQVRSGLLIRMALLRSLLS